MYIVFFLMWIIFNGRITLEIAVFGIVIAACMYAFICKFMDYSIKKDSIIFRKIFYIIQYVCVLVWEIVKANWTIMKMILSLGYENKPVMVHFKTHLKSKTARVILANSITLTPGTITVSLEGDAYAVHCLDRSLAQGINTSVFVKLLEKLERE